MPRLRAVGVPLVASIALLSGCGGGGSHDSAPTAPAAVASLNIAAPSLDWAVGGTGSMPDLFAHAGGFVHDPPYSLCSGVTPMVGRQNIADYSLLQPPASTPGVYSYSNLGYEIAGAAIERVTGQPYETLIRQEVWTPLGITTAGFGPPGTQGLENEPLGHSGSVGAYAPVYADNPTCLGPAGTAYMGMADYAKYLAAVDKAVYEAGDTPVLTSADWLAMLRTPYVLVLPNTFGYSYGWTWLPAGASFGLQHSGSNTYWDMFTQIVPSPQQYAISVVTNAADTNAQSATIAAWFRLQQYLNTGH